MNSNNNKKKIGLIASIVVACYIALVAAIGFIGKNSFTPKIIDSMFGITEYVFKQMTKRVDSGYSKTFIFAPGSHCDDNTLRFYAEEGQSVKMTIDAHAVSPETLSFRVDIDGKPWESPRTIPFNIVHGTITKYLRFDVEPGGDLHTLRFVPDNLKNNSIVIIQCLILVYANGGKNNDPN
jgi:hypothetical protein